MPDFRTSRSSLGRVAQTIENIAFFFRNGVFGKKDGSDYARLPAFRVSAGTFISMGQWTTGTAYALAAHVKPTTANGFAYECTTAGTTGATEPTWPTVAGSTVVDNTATWTCRTMTPASIFLVET